jgi:hypothetical protein
MFFDNFIDFSNLFLHSDLIKSWRFNMSIFFQVVTRSINKNLSWISGRHHQIQYLGTQLL